MVIEGCVPVSCLQALLRCYDIGNLFKITYHNEKSELAILVRNAKKKMSQIFF